MEGGKVKLVELLFLNMSRERASAWIECVKRQGIVKDIHFVKKREENQQWEESITIDGNCASFYDIKLFLTNCRRECVGEGRLVQMVDTPPFFSLTENFDRKEVGNEYKDGYRESGIVYRCHGANERRCYYPQAPLKNFEMLFGQRPALFLDRDGIINVDKGYVFRSEDIELCPGIEELVEAAKKMGQWVCVASNQSGIGRGYYSWEQVESLHQFIGGILPVDRWFFCPHHPEGKEEYRGFSHYQEARARNDFECGGNSAYRSVELFDDRRQRE